MEACSGNRQIERKPTVKGTGKCETKDSGLIELARSYKDEMWRQKKKTILDLRILQLCFSGLMFIQSEWGILYFDQRAGFGNAQHRRHFICAGSAILIPIISVILFLHFLNFWNNKNKFLLHARNLWINRFVFYSCKNMRESRGGRTIDKGNSENIKRENLSRFMGFFHTSD